jgi:hypothetical protein
MRVASLIAHPKAALVSVEANDALCHFLYSDAQVSLQIH